MAASHQGHMLWQGFLISLWQRVAQISFVLLPTDPHSLGGCIVRTHGNGLCTIPRAMPFRPKATVIPWPNSRSETAACSASSAVCARCARRNAPGSALAAIDWVRAHTPQ